MTNNDLQNATEKIKDRSTRTPLKAGRIKGLNDESYSRNVSYTPKRDTCIYVFIKKSLKIPKR
jgi:hypothetical protein